MDNKRAILRLKVIIVSCLLFILLSLLQLMNALFFDIKWVSRTLDSICLFMNALIILLTLVNWREYIKSSRKSEKEMEFLIGEDGTQFYNFKKSRQIITILTGLSFLFFALSIFTTLINYK